MLIYSANQVNKSKLSIRKNPKRKKKYSDVIDLEPDEIYHDLEDELESIKSKVSSVEERMKCLLDENICLKNEIVSLKSAVQRLNSDNTPKNNINKKSS